MHNISCSGCRLGYEEPDENPGVCVKPSFRPWKHWNEVESAAYRDLTNALGDTLYLRQIYTTPPVALEPKHERFVGFHGDYNQITYELDFTSESKVCCDRAHDSWILACVSFALKCLFRNLAAPPGNHAHRRRRRSFAQKCYCKLA